MSLHVVIGAGPIGSATASLLAAEGHHVRVVSRGGAQTSAVPGLDTAGRGRVEPIAADATDKATLVRLTEHAEVIYNCANPAYHRWPQLWPPLADSILAAATRSGAVLVTMSNLYGYGPVDTAMTEDCPLAATSRKGRVRADMWLAALAAHQAGQVRVTEARASDYLGPGAQSLLTLLITAKVKAAKPVYAPVNFDVPHTVTYTIDAARTLVELGRHEAAWGRAWHVPSNPATTLRHLAQRYAQLLGVRPPRLRTMSAGMLRLGGLFSTQAREVVEMRYQFDRPFVMDSSAAQRAFQLVPAATDEILSSMR